LDTLKEINKVIKKV